MWTDVLREVEHAPRTLQTVTRASKHIKSFLKALLVRLSPHCKRCQWDMGGGCHAEVGVWLHPSAAAPAFAMQWRMKRRASRIGTQLTDEEADRGHY